MSAAEIREFGLVFPDAHKHKETIMTLSRTLKDKNGADFCELPFCHTLEAESMGGAINYGDETNGPRAKAYITESLADILALPEIDYAKGRMHEALSAAESLSREVETVLLHVSGPFTILNILIDPKYVFKAMRKEPEITTGIFRKIMAELLRFLAEARKRGVKMISFADPAGGVQILGPKMTARYVDEFVYPFLKEAEGRFGKDLLVVLCPKTTHALLGTDRAAFYDVDLGEAVSYGAGLVSLIGKETFAGQICIKDQHIILKNGRIKTVRLL